MDTPGRNGLDKEPRALIAQNSAQALQGVLSNLEMAPLDGAILSLESSSFQVSKLKSAQRWLSRGNKDCSKPFSLLARFVVVSLPLPPLLPIPGSPVLLIHAPRAKVKSSPLTLSRCVWGPL